MLHLFETLFGSCIWSCNRRCAYCVTSSGWAVHQLNSPVPLPNRISLLSRVMTPSFSVHFHLLLVRATFSNCAKIRFKLFESLSLSPPAKLLFEGLKLNHVLMGTFFCIICVWAEDFIVIDHFCRQVSCGRNMVSLWSFNLNRFWRDSGSQEVAYFFLQRPLLRLRSSFLRRTIAFHAHHKRFFYSAQCDQWESHERDDRYCVKQGCALQKYVSHLRVSFGVKAAKKAGLQDFLFPELRENFSTSEEMLCRTRKKRCDTLASLSNAASSSCSVLKSA